MIRTVSLLALLAVLAACGDGQPLYEDNEPDEQEEPPVTVPEAIAGTLNSASYSPSANDGDGRLVVGIESLDTTPERASYRRNEDLDVRGFRAFSRQEDPLDRFFTGLARRSTDGSMQAVVVADGGQFNRFFGGVQYERLTPYSPFTPSQPSNGLVSYAGDYAGLLNLNALRPNETLPVPPGTDPALIPGQASRVTGDVFINADFTDNRVNGAIVDRRIVDYRTPLRDVNLVEARITENGTFAGTVELDVDQGIGPYSGAFGGTGATTVAGGVALENHIDEVDNEFERGIFVLTRCGRPGDAAICDDVNPRRN